VSEETCIRTAVVTDDELVREGLVALMERSPDLQVAGSWGNAEEALTALPAVRPDVLVVDIRLPQGSAFRLLKALHRVSPGTRALVTVECREESCYVLSPGVLGGAFRAKSGSISQLPRPDDCLQLALKMGAYGVVRRQCSFAQLSDAIHEIRDGKTVLEPATAQRLAEQYLVSFRHANTEPDDVSENLTLRERQIVQLIAQGRSNKEIAREMQLAYSTVKNYVSSILEKLGLEDRTQIALYAVSSKGKLVA
jgi:two-component system, NarL family, response regulator DevR